MTYTCVCDYVYERVREYIEDDMQACVQVYESVIMRENILKMTYTCVYGTVFMRERAREYIEDDMHACVCDCVYERTY